MNALVIVGMLLASREQVYQGAGFAGQLIPRFERGYLLFAKRPCQLTVYHPSGRLLFTQTLQGPKGMACSAIQAAVDSDGTFAVGISYAVPEGYAGGIVLLGANGKQTAVIETKRFMPSHVAFGPDHSIWSIGWQRDAVQHEIGDREDYAIVRRFNREGRPTGAFLQRSLWPGKGDPVYAHGGHWSLAVAKDRLGAFVRSNEVHEWIEWNFDGQLISRTPLPEEPSGRAYTVSGKLYATLRDSQKLVVLDTQSQTWKPVPEPVERFKLLLGADGDELVFTTLNSSVGTAELVWFKPQQQ